MWTFQIVKPKGIFRKIKGLYMTNYSFKVDTRLAILLSENYRSPEKALKELVDNAWDA